MRKILEACPSCGADFEVTRLTCTTCETVVSGRYSPCRFCKLPPESLQFLEAFVRNRGNVKEMERELGISYWAVRSTLNELITELGLESKPESLSDDDLAAQRSAILDQVSQGELSATDAAAQLAKLQ